LSAIRRHLRKAAERQSRSRTGTGTSSSNDGCFLADAIHSFISSFDWGSMRAVCGACKIEK
jgi:hypothetical protein